MGKLSEEFISFNTVCTPEPCAVLCEDSTRGEDGTRSHGDERKAGGTPNKGMPWRSAHTSANAAEAEGTVPLFMIPKMTKTSFYFSVTSEMILMKHFFFKETAYMLSSRT